MSGPESIAFQASNTGDLPTLQRLFAEHGVTSEDTGACGSYHSMIWAACQGQQVEMLAFLLSSFPDACVDSDIIGSALEQNNVGLVREICRHDPAAANGVWKHHNVLGFACSVTKNPEIVKVLLDAGADPNKGPEHIGWPDIDVAITSGLPASTLGHFFDGGYNQGSRLRGLVSSAVWLRRPDLVEVLYARGQALPDANLPGSKELMKMVKKSKDKKMIDLVKYLFPEAFPGKPGLLARLLAQGRNEKGSNSTKLEQKVIYAPNSSTQISGETLVDLPKQRG